MLRILCLKSIFIVIQVPGLPTAFIKFRISCSKHDVRVELQLGHMCLSHSTIVQWSLPSIYGLLIKLYVNTHFAKWLAVK